MGLDLFCMSFWAFCRAAISSSKATMMSSSNPWVISTHLGLRQPDHDLFHVVAHVADRLGKGHGRAFFVQHRQGLVGLDDDRGFFAAEAAGLDVAIPIAIGPRHAIDPLGAFVDFDLGFEHFAEPGFEHGEHPGHLFLAQLAEDGLELGLGQLQFALGFFLFLDGVAALGLFQLALSFAHFRSACSIRF